MKYAHVGIKYIVTNAERTKFLAFAGLRRYSLTVDDLVGAEKFSKPEDAQKTIDAGSWGAISEDKLLFVVPVEVAVAIERTAAAVSCSP